MTKNYEDLMTKFIELRGLSNSTKKAYLSSMRKFVNYYDISPDKITLEQIRDYQHYLIKKKKLSGRTVNREMTAIKLYYIQILERYSYNEKIPRVKTKKSLPVILSQEEVFSMIDSLENIFWKAVIMVTYSAGLRQGEVRRLKVTDIDSKRMVIHVRNSKGGRSREALLSPAVLEQLRNYWRICRKNSVKSDYLFIPTKNSYDGELKKSLSHTALGYIVKKSAEIAGIKKKYILIV